MSLVLNVEILGEFKKLTAATTGAQSQLQKMNSAASKVSSGMNKVLGAIGIGFSLAAITRGLGDAIQAAERVQESDKRLQQVAKSMALFGDETATVTSKMKKYADRLELTTGVEAETTKLVQAKLLTFKQLGKTAGDLDGQFDRATKAALDLAATGFGTAETNAIQLGKALQDPIKGIGALARAGVTFTDQEKEKIKVLVESNRILEAQDLILGAIEDQVGGVAEATAKSSDKIKNAFGQIEDAIGLALLPLLDEFSEWLATPEGSARLEEVIQFAKDVITGFANMAKWVIDNKDWLAPMVVAIGTITTAWKLALDAAKAYAAIAGLGAIGTAAGAAGGAVAGIALGSAAGGFMEGQQRGATSQIYAGGFNAIKPNAIASKKQTTIVQNIKATQSAQQITALLNKELKASGSKTIIRGGR